uniref:Putative ovule protein n=1 Tax=Solanum chacoense TaxID=4108 RepID=A0A0V0GUV6_SOLCH
MVARGCWCWGEEVGFTGKKHNFKGLHVPEVEWKIQFCCFSMRGSRSHFCQEVSSWVKFRCSKWYLVSK